MGLMVWANLVVVGLFAASFAGQVFPEPMSAEGPDFLQVTSFDVRIRNRNAVTLLITTAADVPLAPNAFIEDPANLVVGYAWADLAKGKVFVLTIHPAIGRDSHQRPDGWHAHTATVAAGATAPNDFCVASIDTTPTAGISIQGNRIKVNARVWTLPFATADVDAAVGFTIRSDVACASGLAVLIRT